MTNGKAGGEETQAVPGNVLEECRAAILDNRQPITVSG